ncbi:type II toxin-antitoxin system HicB family antitoxin [Candidatus Poribacteria bacterium]|nr:type II toxin-antitoxin system HicB family antitoxin [Candidatus Poribacteria bacterium]
MKTNNHDDFDGFMINVFFDEDGDYLAHLVELPNVSAFGATPSEALTELKTAWELMKECYQADGEPLPQAPSRKGYEGPLNIPVDAQLYHALADEAAKSGMSLYALVAQKLSEPVSADGNRNHLSRKLNSKSLSEP